MAEGFGFDQGDILRSTDPNLEIVDGHAVKNPVDYQDPDALYESLVTKITKYHPAANIPILDKAYEIVNQAGATPTWDAECGQNYAEWTSGDIIYKVWLEGS